MTADLIQKNRLVTWRQNSGNHPMKIAKRKIIFKNKCGIRDLCDDIKHISIHIIGIPGEERKGRREYI